MRNPWSRGIPLPFILVPAAAIAGGLWWWSQQRKEDEPFAGTPPLDYADYLERPRALQGSSFSLLATLDSTVRQEEGGAMRIITVMPETGDRSARVPVSVPAEFLPRLQVGRRFWFRVVIAGHRSLVVQDLREA